MLEINGKIEFLFPKETPVIFLHAHADDESFLTAGFMNELINRGRKCVIVYTATALVPNEPRTVIRQIEAKNACKQIGILDIRYLKYCEPKYLGFGSCRFIDENIHSLSKDLYETLEDFLIKGQCIIISYDQNGGYGNQDHKLLNKMGRQFYSDNKEKIKGFYEITLNRNFLSDWIKHTHKMLGENFVPQLSYWDSNFGLPESDITYYYSLTPRQLEIKRKALEYHKSQISLEKFPLILSENDFNDVFGLEFLFEPKDFKW